MLWGEAELPRRPASGSATCRALGRDDGYLLMMASLTLAAGLMLPGAGRAAENAPAGRYADLPGVKLWFTDSGGTGTPVVLLHANTGTSASWEPQAAAFVREGYRVIAFDRRGWGKSIGRSRPARSPAASPAISMRWRTISNSTSSTWWGSRAAVSFRSTTRHGDRSGCAAWWWRPAPDSSAKRKCKTSRRGSRFPELRKQAAVYREVGPSYRGANPEGTKRWIEIEERAQQPGAPSQPLRTPNTFAKLATVTMPILVMAADADLLAPPAMMRTWAAHLKGYEWATVPDSGHAIAWEHPDVFNEEVLAFIKRH